MYPSFYCNQGGGCVILRDFQGNLLDEQRRNNIDFTKFQIERKSIIAYHIIQCLVFELKISFYEVPHGCVVPDYQINNDKQTGVLRLAVDVQQMACSGHSEEVVAVKSSKVYRDIDYKPTPFLLKYRTIQLQGHAFA